MNRLHPFARDDVRLGGCHVLAKEGSEGAGTRTLDLRIKSPLLYQLSYALERVLQS